MIPALIDILFEYLAVYFSYRQPDKTAEFFARGELPVRVADRAAVGGSLECFPETREKADCGAVNIMSFSFSVMQSVFSSPPLSAVQASAGVYGESEP